MMKHKINSDLVRLTDDIIININDIDCIYNTNEHPTTHEKLKKNMWIVYFKSGRHYEWIAIDDYSLNKLKEYINNF